MLFLFIYLCIYLFIQLFNKLNVLVISSDESTLTGYVHLISPVQTSHRNTGVKYFNMALETSQNESVQLVCYSPEKRTMLQQSQEKQLPVKIPSAQMSPNKRFSPTDEYTISKKAKIMQTSLEFSNNNDLSNRYVSVEDALKADLYQTVDVEVKVLHKSPLKETLFQGNCTKCKTDVIVADHTNSAKLVLWEDIIDKVDSVKSYRFNNCKIRIFDDHKYINTNEFTKITEIEDIKNVNLLSPQIQENMINAKCMGVEVKKSSSCILCNRKLDDSQLQRDY